MSFQNYRYFFSNLCINHLLSSVFFHFLAHYFSKYSVPGVSLNLLYVLLLQSLLICLQHSNFILYFVIDGFHPLLPRINSQTEDIFRILLHEIEFIHFFHRSQKRVFALAAFERCEHPCERTVFHLDLSFLWF